MRSPRTNRRTMLGRAAVFASLLAAAALVAPSAAADGADRDLAEALAAEIALVVEEGRRFAGSMDALARARRRAAQALEESLEWVREANDLDRRAWEATGAAYRLRLFDAVLAASDEAAARAAAREERRLRQERELAATESAVDLRTAELLAAARELAALAEPLPPDERLAFVEAVLVDVAAHTEDAETKARLGELLGTAALARSTVEALGERESGGEP